MESLAGVLGRGGYEGIQNDSDGTGHLEDASGAAGKTDSHARQPVGFRYRFVPKNRTNRMPGRKVQALQVTSIANPGQPIVFHGGRADQDILSGDVEDHESPATTAGRRLRPPQPGFLSLLNPLSRNDFRPQPEIRGNFQSG